MHDVRVEVRGGRGKPLSDSVEETPSFRIGALGVYNWGLRGRMSDSSAEAQRRYAGRFSADCRSARKQQAVCATVPRMPQRSTEAKIMLSTMLAARGAG